MNYKFGALLVAVLGLALTGCEKAAKSVSQPLTMMSLQTAGLGGRPLMAMRAYADSPTQRFVAEHHSLEIIAPEAEVQKSWDSVVAFCSSIHCEVLSSTITTKAGNSVPSGSVAMRVVPEDLGKLLTHVQRVGRIAQHTTEREDKTTAVVDTEAKIKNLTGFRDNLRAMLKKPSATVKELVEIQQQLTETQSELDSETAQRKNISQ